MKHRVGCATCRLAPCQRSMRVRFGIPAKHARLRVSEFDLVPWVFDRCCISVLVRVQALVVLLEEAGELWKLEQRRVGGPPVSAHDVFEFVYHVEGRWSCLIYARRISVHDGDNSSDGFL